MLLHLQSALLALIITTFAGFNIAVAETQVLPVPNTVTMIDLGADSCIPCKMMAPILAKLKVEYQGKAAIVFIDVWKNPTEGNKFGIQLIPTQIFYDKNGKEITRHEGFMAEKRYKNTVRFFACTIKTAVIF